MSTAQGVFRVGLIGARGHVGSELIRLLARHPHLELCYVSSRERAGQLLSAFETEAPEGLYYVNYCAEQAVQAEADVVVLALPNGLAADWVRVFDAAGSAALLLDLSADFRFDPDWYYGLPELTRERAAGQRRISNPGCYATAMQLAIAPMREALAGPAVCFGVSGYSGAGTTSSDKNNPDKLKDNFMPYALIGHLHEREVAAQMACPVQFMPHVAPHFRGLSVTVSLPLARQFTHADILAHYQHAYGNEPFLYIAPEIPQLTTVVNTPQVHLGGFALADAGRRLVLVCVLDNLLKGAASQALQNMNRGLGLPETIGIL